MCFPGNPDTRQILRTAVLACLYCGEVLILMDQSPQSRLKCGGIVFQQCPLG